MTQFAVRRGWPQARLTPPMNTPMARYGDLPHALIAFSDGAEQASNACPLYQVAVAPAG